MNSNPKLSVEWLPSGDGKRRFNITGENICMTDIAGLFSEGAKGGIDLGGLLDAVKDLDFSKIFPALAGLFL